MTEARQTRADNYRIKREAEFRCEHTRHLQDQYGHEVGQERCPSRDQLLVCDLTGGEPIVLCQAHLDSADGRSVKVRPHQWLEAEELREQLRKREAAGGKRPSAA